MNKYKLFLMVLVLLLTPIFSSARAETFPYLLERNLTSHRSIASSVWAVMGEMVFLTTEEHTTRTIGLRAWEEEGFGVPEEGDEVSLILDYGNTIIDVTEAGGKGGFFGNEARGKVHLFNGPNMWIAIERDDGEMQAFALKDAAATKLNGIEPGRPIILALDGENRVMDVYRP